MIWQSRFWFDVVKRYSAGNSSPPCAKSAEYLLGPITFIVKLPPFCGITINDKSKVRNGDFYDRCMENANKHLENDDDDQEDPFVL